MRSFTVDLTRPDELIKQVDVRGLGRTCIALLVEVIEVGVGVGVPVVGYTHSERLVVYVIHDVLELAHEYEHLLVVVNLLIVEKGFILPYEG